MLTAWLFCALDRTRGRIPLPARSRFRARPTAGRNAYSTSAIAVSATSKQHDIEIQGNLKFAPSEAQAFLAAAGTKDLNAR
ncbi:MAG: hypothetical protein DMG57_03020 [Acidobacteria bacterium]|nr:MAG: hypothetical protein DMG57_03020 [Acidobacteriota bacterium]